MIIALAGVGLISCLVGSHINSFSLICLAIALEIAALILAVIS